MRGRAAGALALAVIVVASAGAKQGIECTTCAIRITSAGFEDIHVYPRLGAKVVWTNVDFRAHGVRQRGGVFESPPLEPSASYERIVSAGDWDYRDPIGGVGFGGFVVVPQLRVVRHSVIARWATADTNTGGHFCVRWAVRRKSVYPYTSFSRQATTRSAGGLKVGQRYIDLYRHRAIVLRRGDRVGVTVWSGLNSRCAGGLGSPLGDGWSKAARSRGVSLR